MSVNKNLLRFESACVCLSQTEKGWFFPQKKRFSSSTTLDKEQLAPGQGGVEFFTSSRGLPNWNSFHAMDRR